MFSIESLAGPVWSTDLRLAELLVEALDAEVLRRGAHAHRVLAVGSTTAGPFVRRVA